MTFRSVSTTRSYEQVVDQLLERIHGGEFAPSQRLPTERELGEEFAYHFEQLVEERTAAGLPREVAEAAARRAMRGAVQQQEECRDNWFVSSVDRFVQDVRYGWRRLRQSPATTMVLWTKLGTTLLMVRLPPTPSSSESARNGFCAISAGLL